MSAVKKKSNQINSLIHKSKMEIKPFLGACVISQENASTKKCELNNKVCNLFGAWTVYSNWQDYHITSGFITWFIKLRIERNSPKFCMTRRQLWTFWQCWWSCRQCFSIAFFSPSNSHSYKTGLVFVVRAVLLNSKGWEMKNMRLAKSKIA